MTVLAASRAVPAIRVPVIARIEHIARALQVYARPSSGPLSFWHETPQSNDACRQDERQYFMRFRGKADYRGPFDSSGVPLLDYRGRIGRQYNPIAIAQYGLGRFNRWCGGGDAGDRAAWLAAARWLTSNLQPNADGVPVWLHHFDWPYRQLLEAPWYSGLAQGSGVSMLVRAAIDTGDAAFARSAHQAFQSLELPVSKGGVLVTDALGHVWIEEYLVDPPSHILNGFIWALWGVYDYARWSRRPDAAALWNEGVRTLEARLGDFDIGWWSLYEAPNEGCRMLASPYYHSLHAVQLRVLHRMTGVAAFAERAETFESYTRRRRYRARALAEKAWFKLSRY